MKIYHIGTAGWDYKDWVGSFYPKSLIKGLYLKYYSRYFNVNEINSTFYNLPRIESIKNWFNAVPDDFSFVVKMWQSISHKLENPQFEEQIIQFFNTMSVLKEKAKVFLIQFPPWLKHSDKHETYVKYLISLLPSKFQYFIEFRDNSWFDKKILSVLKHDKNLFYVTSYLEGLVPYFMNDQETYYIRLIGDRTLSSFGKVQRTQEKDLNHLQNNLAELEKNSKVREIFIIVNNHFSGFAPETANHIKQMLNLPYKKFDNQKRITDFLL
jgi:uncharacterized protein YecE (DUF72 family)